MRHRSTNLRRNEGRQTGRALRGGTHMIEIRRIVAHALRGAAVLLVVLAAGQARAAWPERNITIIVPFPAGGPNDLLGRLLAAELAPKLGQNVIVENRVGAVGNIGIAAGARAGGDPD